GKAERLQQTIPLVSLHIHEVLRPKDLFTHAARTPSIIQQQQQLFEPPPDLPLRKAFEFYQHPCGWINRLIAGDSLLVMTSLAEKEGLRGKVQMIFFDPPFGIKYRSNFQPYITNTNVEDDDLTTEPEQIRAFRDTWELGIHSYLSYLRDRLAIARELLADSGSIFVQINETNVHYVRCLLDEIFGHDNCMRQIVFAKAGTKTTQHLARTCDYLLWYAKHRPSAKIRQLFQPKSEKSYRRQENVDDQEQEESYMTLTAWDSEHKNKNRDAILHAGLRLLPPPGTGWVRSTETIYRLLRSGYMVLSRKNTLRRKIYRDSFPYSPLREVWDDVVPGVKRRYAVQTALGVVRRCLLMATDPGDLVLDPTCGSGTTAYVAEQYGRRWITIDTSRVAIAIARQRLLTATYDYYQLARPQEGVAAGFCYETVPHITHKSIGDCQEIDRLWEQAQPQLDRHLEELNAAIQQHGTRIAIDSGARSGQYVDGHAPPKPYTLPSGDIATPNALLHWEVPQRDDPSWPEPVRVAWKAYQAARSARDTAIQNAIRIHAEQQPLYDRPLIDRSRVRITGPFSVEAIPAPIVALAPDTALASGAEPRDEAVTTTTPAGALARSGQTAQLARWIDELRTMGVIVRSAKQRWRFKRLEVLPAAQWIHAVGELSDDQRTVAVSFGPEHRPMDTRQVQAAWEEAQTLSPRPHLLIFASFHFDPEAMKDIDQMNPQLSRMEFARVQMHPDLLVEDLKKSQRGQQSFWLVGEPDVSIDRKPDGHYVVSVIGFDYYDLERGIITSGDANKIAIWMLDTDYDGRFLVPSQIFFPTAQGEEDMQRIARDLRAEIDEEAIQAFCGTTSLPFQAGDYKRIAVKIIDINGVESMRIITLHDGKNP
ncbi:MAG: site-specific DNA-methyltransferase, partial [Rectinema sp.]|nr:site-specific DNA-methyltransferase [Rectinema sp.]